MTSHVTSSIIATSLENQLTHTVDGFHSHSYSDTGAGCSSFDLPVVVDIVVAADVVGIAVVVFALALVCLVAFSLLGWVVQGNLAEMLVHKL